MHMHHQIDNPLNEARAIARFRKNHQIDNINHSHNIIYYDSEFLLREKCHIMA